MKSMVLALLILASQISSAQSQSLDEKYAAWVMMRLKSIVQEKMYSDEGQLPRSEEDLYKFCKSSHVDTLHREFAELKRLPPREMNNIEGIQNPGDGWVLPASVGYCATNLDSCMTEKVASCENSMEIIEKNRVTPLQAGYIGGTSDGGIPALCKKFMQAMAKSIKETNTDLAKCRSDEIAQAAPPAQASPLPVNLNRGPSSNKGPGAASPR